jgi:hypothetical protein
MSAREELAGLYDEWLRLTERESEAIAAGAWPVVASHQQAKLALQQYIAATSDRLKSERPGDAAGRTSESNPFKENLDHLIALESRNAETIAAKRRVAESERAQLDRASQNLRLVQRSYGSSPTTAWHSYS